MEGVATVMPMGVSAQSILKAALPLAGGGGSSGGGVNEVAEARAQAVENQARRQAEAQRQSSLDRADALRESGEKRRASARVGAATSGLSLSGTSLLSLESIQGETDEAVGEVLGAGALAGEDILASAADQARSIRLSGRMTKSRSGGDDSILRLGGQILSGGFGGVKTYPTFPTFLGM